MSEQEKIEFKAAVSLQHLPRERWEGLLKEADYRVRMQIAVARRILVDVSSHFSFESLFGVYDRLSELMPRPFPEISPAEEEEVSEETVHKIMYDLPKHVDRTGD